MAAKPRNRRHLALSCAALLAGLISGAALRPSAARTGSPAHASASPAAFPTTSAGSHSTRSFRHRREISADQFTFSHRQWSQLVRRPGAFEIPIHKSGGGEVPILNDVPVIGRLFQKEHQGPELREHAAFFGWDEQGTAEVKQLLFRLAAELRDVRSENVRLEYPGGGTVVLDFSPAASQVADLLRQAESALDGIGGDGRRLMIVAGIDRWDVDAERISVRLAESGALALTTSTGGRLYVNGDLTNHVRVDGLVPFIGPSAPPIDLKRLADEARSTGIVDR